MADLRILPIEKKIPYEASVWQKIQVLLDASEFAAILNREENLKLFRLSGLFSEPTSLTPKESALDHYRAYLEGIQNRHSPSDAIKSQLNMALTLDDTALYALKSNDAYIIKPEKPVIQTSLLYIDYSRDEQAFKANLYGQNTIPWGMQFSFPHLFEDPLTKQVFKVNDPKMFPNCEFFKTLQKWTRENTRPAVFEVEGKTIQTPLRIGKNALKLAARLLEPRGITCL